MSEENISKSKEDKQAAVRAEIKKIALHLLQNGGFENLSMHKIAREMKTTTPALYYYYKNRDALLTDLTIDTQENLETFLRETHAAHSHEAYIRQAFVILSGYYNWARENPDNYRLLYGNPLPDYERQPATSRQILRSMSVFLEVCQKAGKMNLLAEPTLALTPDMREQLLGLGAELGVELSPEILYLVIIGWSRLHGLISLELNGYLTQVITNLDRTYFLEARKLLDELGFNYRSSE